MVRVNRAKPGADTFKREDVAESGRAEEDLQETKELFGVLVESALTGIYLIQDDRFRYVNPAAVKMFGYTAAEMMNNLSPLDVVHPADRPLVQENLRRRIDGEFVEAHYQFRGLRKDGSSFPVLVQSRSIQLAGKIGVMGTLVDNSDIQRAMDKLRESEAKSEEMQRLAHVGWWEADFRTERMSLSEEVCRSFGVQPDDLPAWRGRWLELVHPEDRARAAEAAAASVRGGPRLDVEYRVVRPDGAVRIVHIRGNVTRDGSGRPLRHFGVLQDITELRRAEDELRASEERFRALVQFSFDVYWETDAEHRFIRQEYVRDLADTPAPGAEIGKTRWEVPYLEPDEEAWRRHRETLDAHLPFRDFELVRPTPDGGRRYVSVSGLPVFDQAGRFVGYRGVGRSTTAQKRAQEALREMQAQVRRLVEANIIGIETWHVDGRILEANDAYLRILGYSREDLVSGLLRWPDLTPPESLDISFARFEEVKRTGIWQTHQKEYFRKDGSRVPVLIGATLLDEERGVSFVVDLTEQKRAEDALREAQMQLAHANRLETMGQLTASIAHEVNQPIAATMTNAQTALRWLSFDPPNMDGAREALDNIVRDAARAGDVVHRIRNLTRRARTPHDRLEINAAVQEVIELTHTEAMRNGVSVRTELAEGLPPVRGDRVELQQVVLNLILNAVEAMSGMSEGPRELRIATSKTDAGDILVAVSDSGPGLAPAVQENLFKAFHTTKPNGLGLGLSICRSIVESHGGRLWASANAPRGAVFQFTLPV